VCVHERDKDKVIKDDKRCVASGDTQEGNIHGEMNILTAVKCTVYQKASHSLAKRLHKCMEKGLLTKGSLVQLPTNG
jgi:hypothetical protein